MERKMLLGIKERAERLARETSSDASDRVTTVVGAESSPRKAPDQG